MKKLILCALVCAALTGCGGKLLLLSEGKAYQGTFDAVSKRIEIDVDGKLYAGNYITNQSYASGGGFIGTRWVGTTSSISGSQGRALLIGKDNATMRCEFSYQGMDAQGTCQDSSGRTYDMTTTSAH